MDGRRELSKGHLPLRPTRGGGPVRLTVKAHDARLDANASATSGGRSSRSPSGPALVTWSSASVGRGRGVCESTPEVGTRGNVASDPNLDEPLEEHLIQFWPGPSIGDLVVVAQDQYGKTLRGQGR